MDSILNALISAVLFLVPTHRIPVEYNQLPSDRLPKVIREDVGRNEVVVDGPLPLNSVDTILGVKVVYEPAGAVLVYLVGKPVPLSWQKHIQANLDLVITPAAGRFVATVPFDRRRVDLTELTAGRVTLDSGAVRIALQKRAESKGVGSLQSVH